MLNRRHVLAAGLAAPFALAAARAGYQSLVVIGDRLFIDVTVNGVAVRALLDSAAESSLLDVAFAARLGLTGGPAVEARGSGGDTDAELVNGVKVQALGLDLPPLTAGVLDLSDVGRRLLHSSLDFIMGRELFDAARLAIDIDGGRIAVVPRDVEPAGECFDLSTDRGIETFAVSVEGHPPVQAVFDLGNGGNVLLGASYAQSLGVLSDGRAIVKDMGGGIGGAVARDTVVLKSLEIAGRSFADVTAAIDRTGSAADLNVGVPLMRRFRITVDFAQHRLWLASA